MALKYMAILGLAFACLLALVLPSCSGDSQVSHKERNAGELNKKTRNLNEKKKEKTFNIRRNRKKKKNKKKQQNKKEKKMENQYRKKRGPCTGTKADRSCCSNTNPCQERQGDCDADSHCVGTLICGKDNCNYFNPQAYRNADCCVKPPDLCPAGWTSVSTGCYRFLKTEATFDQAETNCKKEGGFVAEADTQTKLNGLSKFYKDSGMSGSVWLGASDVTKEGEWIWVHSGKKMTFNSWGKGEPNNAGGNEDCVHWDGNTHWNDLSCSFSSAGLQTLCEYKGPCTGTPADMGCCSNTNLCHERQGDCNADSHCAGTLICGKNNCKDFNPQAQRSADCCVKPPVVTLTPTIGPPTAGQPATDTPTAGQPTTGPPTSKGSCTGTPADMGCCSNTNLCHERQGDCDADSHCAGTLICGKNNCNDFNPQAHWSADCCVKPPVVTLTPTAGQPTTDTPTAGQYITDTPTDGQPTTGPPTSGPPTTGPPTAYRLYPEFDNCGFNLSATCDDHMQLFADGNLLAESDDWRRTSVVYIPPNTTEIEIRCTDRWILGGILASSNNGLVTNNAWNCSSDNGDPWHLAYELGENNVTSKDISPHAKWIWTDKPTWRHTNLKDHTTAICTIQLPKCPPSTPTPTNCTGLFNGTTPTTTPTSKLSLTPTPVSGFDLKATCNNKMKLFVDGNLLATSFTWRDTSPVHIPENTQTIEIHCSDSCWIKGILASSDNGLITDALWNCSSDNGITWSSAHEIVSNGLSVPDISPNAKWISTGQSTWRMDGGKVMCKVDLATQTAFQVSTTPVPTGCEYTDKYVECPEFKDQCKSEEFGDCMERDCAKTCKCISTKTAPRLTVVTKMEDAREIRMDE